MENREDTNSLFTETERANYSEVEKSLVAEARQGNMGELLNFWKEKKSLFTFRAFERSTFAKS